MEKRTWEKETLNTLYWAEGKTLAEIGEIYGVSRERVRQVMEGFGVLRTKKRKHTCPATPTYRDLATYLSDYTKHPLREDPRVMRRLGDFTVCSECGSRKNVHIHHIRYPAHSIDDLQALCAPCHFIKHRSGMTLVRQYELYADRMDGMRDSELAEKYGLSKPTVYKIIRKIRMGHRSLNEGWYKQG